MRNTAIMLAGAGARLFTQAIYFVLIARALGADQYGAFIGVVALMTVLSPFAPLGTGQIIVRNVARDRRSFSYSWGNALAMTVMSGSALLGLALLLSRIILSDKVPLDLVFFVGLSELLCAAISSVAAMAFVAVEQLRRTTQVQLALTATRAVAAVFIVMWVKHPTAISWGRVYCLSSAIGAIYAIVLVCGELGYPRLEILRFRGDLLEGLYFAISLSSASIYNNIDKTMLVRLSSFSAAGIYAAAYRLVDLAFQPVSALLASAFPKFFQHGEQGLRGTKNFAKRLLPFAIGYALVAGALLILAAPLLPYVLGHDFGESVGALRWLSPIVLFRAVHSFLADALTGAGFQGLRSGVQIFVAGLNIVFNFWLIPRYTWRGAAWASLGSDGMLALFMLVAILVLGRRESLSTIVRTSEPETMT